jgi:hypothetical protein
MLHRSWGLLVVALGVLALTNVVHAQQRYQSAHIPDDSIEPPGNIIAPPQGFGDTVSPPSEPLKPDTVLVAPSPPLGGEKVASPKVVPMRQTDPR